MNNRSQQNIRRTSSANAMGSNISQSGSSKVNGKKIFATLDLHFQRRDEAMRSLSEFLSRAVVEFRSVQEIKSTTRSRSDEWQTPERGRQRRSSQQEVWVLVITGTGKHSGNNGGPVLRTAVQQVLDKRCMKYELVNGKGAFIIQADSGHVLYKDGPPTDSKVIIQPANVEDAEEKVAVKRLLNQKGRRTHSLPDIGRINNTTDDNPLPREAHEEAEAMRLSLEEHARERTKRQKDEEEETLMKALSLSLKMQECKQASAAEKQKDEASDLRRAIDESAKLAKEHEEKENKELYLALELSSLQLEDNSRQRSPTSSAADTEQEREFNRVLEISRNGSQAVTEAELLRMALEQSLKDL